HELHLFTSATANSKTLRIHRTPQLAFSSAEAAPRRRHHLPLPPTPPVRSGTALTIPTEPRTHHVAPPTHRVEPRRRHRRILRHRHGAGHRARTTRPLAHRGGAS